MVNTRTIDIDLSFWWILVYTLGRQLIIKKFERKQIEKYNSCVLSYYIKVYYIKVITNSYNYNNDVNNFKEKYLELILTSSIVLGSVNSAMSVEFLLKFAMSSKYYLLLTQADAT